MSLPPTVTGSSSVCCSLRMSGPTACSSVTAMTTTSSLPPTRPTVSSARRTEVRRRDISQSTVFPVV